MYSLREIAKLFGLTKVFLNSYDILWKVLASLEVIIPQIQLCSFIEMVLKALSIARNSLVYTMSNTRHEILICTEPFHKRVLGASGSHL